MKGALDSHEPVTALAVTERFEVRGRLGQGGMGIVYRAYDRERRTEVALKVLPRMEPGAMHRFKQEFRALTDVTHPNLVVLHELIATGDHWFFTMELVDGVDLVEWVCGGTRSADAAPFPERPLESGATRKQDTVHPVSRRAPAAHTVTLMAGMAPKARRPWPPSSSNGSSGAGKPWFFRGAATNVSPFRSRRSTPWSTRSLAI